MSVEDSTHLNLQAAVRAIDGAIAPVVEAAGDPLATEQIGLVRAYLAFLLQRVDLLPDRSRYEFDHYRDLAATLAGILAEHDHADAPLQEAVDAAREVSGNPGSSYEQLTGTTALLRAAISRAVRATGPTGRAPADAALTRAVEVAVLRSSEQMIEFDRAWFLPRGWEPEPELVRSLDDVLADVRARPATAR